MGDTYVIHENNESAIFYLLKTPLKYYLAYTTAIYYQIKVVLGWWRVKHRRSH